MNTFQEMGNVISLFTYLRMQTEFFRELFLLQIFFCVNFLTSLQDLVRAGLFSTAVKRTNVC